MLHNVRNSVKDPRINYLCQGKGEIREIPQGSSERQMASIVNELAPRRPALMKWPGWSAICEELSFISF